MTAYCKNFLYLILIGTSLGFGQHDQAGTNIFPFLSLGYDARSMAMSNVFAAVENDLYGTLGNPAAAAFVQSMQGMVSFQPVVMDVKAGSMGFARPVQDKGVIAASLLYLSYGVIDGIDRVNGEIVRTGKTYRPYAVCAGATWSKIFFDNMGLGATIKGIYSNLGGEEGYAAHGMAVDLGWQYRMLDSRLIYGLMIRNAGYLLSGYTEKTDGERIPFEYRAGLSYRPENFSALMLSADLQKMSDDYLNYRLATELNAYKDFFLIRGGFVFSQKDLREKFRDWFNLIEDTAAMKYQKSNWYIWSLGLGINAPLREIDFRVDAAINFRIDWLPPSMTVGFLTQF